MSGVTMQRTWWGVVLGLVLIGTGLVVLADVVAASVVSVKFLGWTLLIGGAVGIGLSVLLRSRGAFRIGMLGGILAVVSGLVFLRYPGPVLLALSLAIGAVLLINGVSRIIGSVRDDEARGALLLTGLLSLAVGIVVFARWPTSALWLIGLLLGIQLIADGVTLILLGRPRPVSA